MCGVFGIWAPGEDVAWLAYLGLHALQHRGEESAGIAVSDGRLIAAHKDMGLVSQVFSESGLSALPGHAAIGHCRYSTCGPSVLQNAQPILRSTSTGSLAVSHNGNLINVRELAELARDRADADETIAVSDTSVLSALLSQPPNVSSRDRRQVSPPRDIEERALAVLPLLRGAFSLIFMDEQQLSAARDPQAFRPLVIGRRAGAWVVASETAALDAVEAAFVREIEPGELVTIGAAGLRSRQFAEAAPRRCLFEYIYLARADSSIAGRSVHAARVDAGIRLAAEHPAAADLVIGVPESGILAAIGYARASGIRYGQGLIKNTYVGRTFIQPSQAVRERGIWLKLQPLRDAVAGHRVVVVDDSIVRGTTQRAVVAMLRDAGATEIHIRISSPPVAWPCFYGIDFASRAQLIADGCDVAEVTASLGADSLRYLSLDGIIAATGQPASGLCRACFDGDYPLLPTTGQEMDPLDAAVQGRA